MARRSVLLALIGAGMSVAVFTGQHLTHELHNHTLSQKLITAHQSAADILLADERLTMSAHMAAETGEKMWIDRYNENIPLIDQAINRALKIAPPHLRSFFDNETRIANRHLVILEMNALRAAQLGRTKEARSILDSVDYHYNKGVLSRGTNRFNKKMIDSVFTDVDAADEKAHVWFGLALSITLIGGVLLWRRLSGSLEKSEFAFLEAEDRIRHLARHDALTGLANRHSFREILDGTLTKAAVSGASIAILMLDLKGLKKINDTKGHLIGDLVLTEVAKRLVKTLSDKGHAARFGGDEFVCLIETTSREEATEITNAFVSSLEQPVVGQDFSVHVGASVGIAFYPDDARDYEDLIRKADLALRKAKPEDTSKIIEYHRRMDEELNERAQLEEELKTGISAGQVVPYYQPIVDLETEQVECFEILSRWEHPTRGLIPPDDFIPLAESSGSIGDLTLSVLRTACITVKALPGNVSIALNIAPQQIQDDWLVQGLLGVITETGFPPERLEVELVENALVSDLAAAKTIITSLKNLGIRVALDDFGTGYSSLCYLSELPFDKIKIDRSFITNIPQREENVKIVNAIVGLGRSLGFHTVAEGVETEEDADFLRMIGCPSAQGFYYAKPTPGCDLPELMASLKQPDVQQAIA